jgi:acetyl/propionyl-CoA carboxylase alpha subunit
MSPSISSSGSATLKKPKPFVARAPTLADGQPRIRRLLIANRGEISCRIISTCKTLNITSIAIYTEEDRESLHVQAADEALCLGSIQQAGGNPHQNVELIIQTALSNQADAIHPGYGYLSENAEFARQVQKANLIFVGPSPDSISVLGDKRQAKDFLMREAPQVPLIPGYNGTAQDVNTLELEAERIGFPVLIKAAAGGGGRGMRIVHEKSSFQGELSSAQSEAKRSFGSSDCLLEKYIERGKHIEVQIMGDSSGEVLSLFERECSIQRRHQKIIEESPSPWLAQDVRHKMVETAKVIGRLLHYESAGTVEFIVDIASAKFYFLEVNTRIQVEHAITEETTGVDIVALQLFIAGGGLLAECDALSDISQSGHSIECRLCAEDPAQDFMPDSGLILRWTPGADLLDSRQRTGVRVETAIRTGSNISVHFDSMIVKIIVWEVDRASAIAKMLSVLRHIICVGIKTNHLFLQACLLHPDFRKIDYSTSFISDHIDDLLLNTFTKTLHSYHERFCFVPPLFARWIASRAQRQSPYQPFGSIRPGFRNQVFDQSNRVEDIVVADGIVPSRGSPHTFLVTWSMNKGAPENTFYYKLRSIPVPAKARPEVADENKQYDSGAELIRHFNAMFTSNYQQSETVVEEHKVQIVQASCHWEHGPGSQQWLTADIILECDGRKEAFYITTDPKYSSKDNGMPQRMFCHVPTLGSSMEYSRYTLLAYGESQRANFQGIEAVDELRMYRSVMPCKVLRLLKERGDLVKKGEAMLVVESMKTEVKIFAALDGTFQPEVAEGDAVGDNVLLCQLLQPKVVDETS